MIPVSILFSDFLASVNVDKGRNDAVENAALYDAMSALCLQETLISPHSLSLNYITNELTLSEFRCKFVEANYRYMASGIEKCEVTRKFAIGL
jgi:hypothetical protein